MCRHSISLGELVCTLCCVSCGWGYESWRCWWGMKRGRWTCFSTGLGLGIYSKVLNKEQAALSFEFEVWMFLTCQQPLWWRRMSMVWLLVTRQPVTSKVNTERLDSLLPIRQKVEAENRQGRLASEGYEYLISESQWIRDGKRERNWRRRWVHATQFNQQAASHNNLVIWI